MNKVRIVTVIALLIIVCWAHNNIYAQGASVILDVLWVSQGVPPSQTVNSMACGPTSLLMGASYLRRFTPTEQSLKDQIDWLEDNSLISSKNNYLLVKGEGTSASDLIASAKYYYGLWNIRKTNVNDIEMLRGSLLKGKPVIVGVRTQMGYSSNDGSVPHFMTLVGMDDKNVYMNDPGRGREKDGRKVNFTITKFISSWSTQNYCALIFNDTLSLGEYSDGWRSNPNYTPQYFQPFSQPFVDCFLNNGGLEPQKVGDPDGIGAPQGKVYRQNGYWVQDFYGNGQNIKLILSPYVYNPSHYYLGVCYPVVSRLRDYWLAYNPGAPCCNEYFKTHNGIKYSVQWFEPRDNDYVCVMYNNSNGNFISFGYNSNECNYYGVSWMDNYSEDTDVNSGYSENGWGMGGGGDEPVITPTTNPDPGPIDHPNDTAIDDLKLYPPRAFSIQAEVGQTVIKDLTVKNIGQLSVSGSINIPYPLVLVSGGVFYNLINGESHATINFTPTEAKTIEVLIALITNVGNRYAKVTLIGLPPPSTPTPIAPPTPANTPQPDGVLFFSDFEDNNPFIKEDHFTADYPNGSVNIFEVQTGVGIDGGKGLVAGNTGVRVNYEVQVKVVGGNVSLQQGKQYRVSGYLRADNNGTISVEVCKNEKDWHSYGLYEDIQVSTDWQYFSFTFTAAGNPQLDININRLSFMRGTLVGNLYLDNIKLELISKDSPNISPTNTNTPTNTPTNTSVPQSTSTPTSTSQQIQPANTPTNTATPTKQQTAPDDFTPTPTTKATLMPTVTPTKVVESINTIFSADFEDDEGGFVIENHDDIATWSTSAYLRFDNGIMVLVNNVVRPNVYNVQAKHVGNIPISNGKNYTITFRVKAKEQGIFALQISNNVSDWSSFGLDKYNISATTDWQYYRFNFTAVKNPELRQDTIRLNFMYGTTQGVLYIDDIVIEEE